MSEDDLKPDAMERIAEEGAQQYDLQKLPQGVMPPHHWLACVMMGQAIKVMEHGEYINEFGMPDEGWHEVEVYPTMKQRMEAAKAAAPYFAPKWTVQRIEMQQNSLDIQKAIKELSEALPV